MIFKTAWRIWRDACLTSQKTGNSNGRPIEHRGLSCVPAARLILFSRSQLENWGGVNLLDVSDLPTCGDGQLEPGEQCDDRNTRSGDGCTSYCAIE